MSEDIKEETTNSLDSGEIGETSSEIDKSQQQIEESKKKPSFFKKAKDYLKAKFDSLPILPHGKKDNLTRGFISFRGFRILGWLSMVAVVMVNFHNASPNSYAFLDNRFVKGMYETFGGLGSSLFLMASFSGVLAQKNTYTKRLLQYLLSALGLALGFIFVYERYVASALAKIGFTPLETDTIVQSLFGAKLNINVFIDMFMCALFMFFLNAKPKRWFKGNQIIAFRLMALIPVFYEMGCYSIRLLQGLGQMAIPTWALAFMTTKSPLTFITFVLISIILKIHKHRYIRLYGEDAFETYYRSNHNSRVFSRISASCFALIGLVDVIVTVCIAASYGDFTQGLTYAQTLGFNMSQHLLIAAPLLFFFSYQKGYEPKYDKLKTFDAVLPLIGIGLMVLAYIEGLYQGFMGIPTEI